MPQNLPTICSHNAPQQVYDVGRISYCRQCGCQLEVEARAPAQAPVAAPNVSPAGIFAGYPSQRLGGLL